MMIKDRAGCSCFFGICVFLNMLDKSSSVGDSSPDVTFNCKLMFSGEVDVMLGLMLTVNNDLRL